MIRYVSVCVLLLFAAVSGQVSDNADLLQLEASTAEPNKWRQLGKKVFDHIDSDHNRKLDGEELSSFLNQIAFGDVTLKQSMDSNGDGTLSPPEFKEVILAALDPKGTSSLLENKEARGSSKSSFSTDAFHAIDVDNDNKLDVSELSRLASNFVNGDLWFKWDFDTNDDGVMSAAEFSNAVAEIASRDVSPESAPALLGQVLFGGELRDTMGAVKTPSQHIKTVFDKIDADRSKDLDVDELTKFGFGKSLAILTMLDVDDDGLLSRAEFDGATVGRLQFAAKGKHTRATLKSKFQALEAGTKRRFDSTFHNNRPRVRRVF